MKTTSPTGARDRRDGAHQVAVRISRKLWRKACGFAKLTGYPSPDAVVEQCFGEMVEMADTDPRYEPRREPLFVRLLDGARAVGGDLRR